MLDAIRKHAVAFSANTDMLHGLVFAEPTVMCFVVVFLSKGCDFGLLGAQLYLCSMTTRSTMNLDEARKWLVITSLGITAATLMFFIAAPVLGYPLTWEQGTRVVEIVIPVFLGYLGSATHFLFQTKKRRTSRLTDASQIGNILVRGPIIVFSLICATALFAFGYSNRFAAPPGSGMSVDTLAWSVTSALGLLAVTTNVAASYLFALERREQVGKADAQAV